MRHASVSSDDSGSAALEFILVGVVLLVPIVYLIVAMGQIQAHALGVEAGARHLARTIATASDRGEADERAVRVIDAIAQEYGIAADAVEVAVACTPVASPCPQAGATVRVTVRAEVALPLVPAVFGLERLARVSVEATGVQKVSRFWGTR